MPSPFPGMDPFLEHPVFFQDLHGAMHVYIREALQAVLPEPYFAVVDERIWVEPSGRPIEPDSIVIRREDSEFEGHGVATATAVATRTQPVAFEVFDDEHQEMFVEIRTRLPDGNERIVTTIEVLSPTNKTPGEKGRDLYLQKQRENLNGEVHLIEIDLLRGGMHTTPMSLEKLQWKLGPFDYHVSLHRFDRPSKFYIYAWKLDSPLPEIAVPLLPGDGEVALDLQKVFARSYDTGPYRRRVRDDAARLAPPLDAERTEWAKQMIGGSGVRV